MKIIYKINKIIILLSFTMFTISLIGLVWNGYGFWFYMTMSSLIALSMSSFLGLIQIMAKY